MKINLEPCPFCGSKAKIGEMHDIVFGDKNGWLIICQKRKCGARLHLHLTKEESIETWNTRVFSKNN